MIIKNMKRFQIELGLFATLITITLGLVQLLPISDNLLPLLPVEAQQQQQPPTVAEIGAPGEKQNEYYIFTQELNANETKVGEPIAVFTLTNIIVHKGDTVTIHFYNTADEPEDRHTFTMQSPYKMDYDLAGGQTKTFSFKADNVGGFTYYCRYDLPSMIGHLEVLP
jgi:plastocyanin